MLCEAFTNSEIAPSHDVRKGGQVWWLARSDAAPLSDSPVAIAPNTRSESKIRCRKNGTHPEASILRRESNRGVSK